MYTQNITDNLGDVSGSLLLSHVLRGFVGNDSFRLSLYSQHRAAMRQADQVRFGSFSTAQCAPVNR